jgi:uncharacterized Fe-S cluster protein YjdI
MAQAPSQAVLDVYADLSHVPPDDQAHMRYLDLGNFRLFEEPKEKVALYIKTLSGHINSLSKKGLIRQPVVVKDYLLRLDLRDYGWDPQVYEQLAEGDPYFHLKVKFTHPAGAKVVIPDAGKAAKDAKDAAKAQEKDLLAPWLAPDQASQEKLDKLYNAVQSQAIVLRADWFLEQTATADGKKVGYYGLLGIKKIQDFEALMRFDRKATLELERARAIVFSEIVLQSRRVDMVRSATGPVWRSFDSIRTVDKQDPLVVLDDELIYDASEQFGHLPNGLPVWWLGNGKGDRQDKAPDNIVGRDRFSQNNDGRLHVGLSCIRCHMRGKSEGLKDFEPAPLKHVPAIDRNKYLELTQKYFGKIEPALQESRLKFKEAYAEAAGMDMKQYADLYQELYSRYVDAKVDLKRAAADLGVVPDNLQKAIDRHDRVLGYVHPYLSILGSGGSIPISQFESVYGLIQAVLRGVQP